MTRQGAYCISDSCAKNIARQQIYLLHIQLQVRESKMKLNLTFSF